MTHTTGTATRISAPTPTKVIDDFLIIEQEPDDRPAVYASGDLYTFYTTTRESGGDFNFFDFFLPVNGGPPPHYHRFEHETWYVTAGEFQFNLGNQGNDRLVVPEGTTVFGPRDRTHGYRNLNSTASLSGVTPGARTLSMSTPGALDLFFEASARRVIDRDELIPTFNGPIPQDYINLAKFAARTNAVGSSYTLDPAYQPPEDALNYILVLPETADAKTVEDAKALDKLDGFDVWTTGGQSGIPRRPTFTGDFGLEYTSLISLAESAGEFSYNQFAFAPHDSDTAESLSQPVVSQERQIFYVTQGELTVQIGDEQRIADKDTYVYIAPGNEYTITNFGDETVKALSISVTNREDVDVKDHLHPSLAEAQGDDLLDASNGSGKNHLDGSEGHDKICVNAEDHAFGTEGDDLLDASVGIGQLGAKEFGHNFLNGGNGNDTLIAGSDGELNGGDGDDTLIIRQGGNNLLSGGAGADRFWIANGELPNAVRVEYSKNVTSLLPEGISLPALADTKNTIADFELGIDRIYIRGIQDIGSSFDDLELLPSFGTLDSTDIIAKFAQEGVKKEISLATVSGIYFNELSAQNFIFS
jgi:quercetin dioxygenase-like cupin family protein